MKFFQKPSIPLLLIGIGILSIVFGLVSVYTLTEKTEGELIDGFVQRVSLDQDNTNKIYGSAGQNLNLQFVGKRSVGGFFSGEGMTLTLRESTGQTPILLAENLHTSGWQEQPLSHSQRTSVIIIPIGVQLPSDLKVGSQVDVELVGAVSYPTRKGNSILDNRSDINKIFTLEVVSQEELLKQVRKRPIWIMAVSFPLSIALMVFGARTELYPAKPRSKS
ncbi:MAG: hypothetical protein WDA04_05640 [Anaerolineaceae bacterium]